MTNPIKIIADHRENASSIPELLKNKGADVEIKTLSAGDYIINNSLLIERKSKDDFALSIIQGRLFTQCSKLKRQKLNPVFLVEGNPYTTTLDIDRQAIKGALLSIAVCWQIPAIFTTGIDDSVNTMLMTAYQLSKSENYVFRSGKPKRAKSKALYFLQGIPTVGSSTAKLLLEKFKSPENIILASTEELMEISGLGKNKAERIRAFLSCKID